MSGAACSRPLLCPVAHSQRHLERRTLIQRDLEGVCPDVGQWDIEYQHGAGFDVHHAGGRLAKLHRAGATHQCSALFIHETNTELVRADLGPPSPDPDDEMGSGMHRREALHPDVLEDSQHAQLAVLVNECVVGKDREVYLQLSSPGST